MTLASDRRAVPGGCPVCGGPAAGLLTVAQAATRYGLPRKLAYRWVRKGALPVVRIGPTKRLRVRVADADRVWQPVEA